MTIGKPRNRKVNDLSWELDRLADLVPEAISAVSGQRTLTSFLRANTGGGEPHGKGSYSDPTAAAVTKLDAADYHIRTINDWITSLQVGTNGLAEAVRAAFRYRAELEDADGNAPSLVPQCTREITVEGITKRCDRHVEHYTRVDGSVGYMSSGICAPCRQADIREKQRERESAA